MMSSTAEIDRAENYLVRQLRRVRFEGMAIAVAALAIGIAIASVFIATSAQYTANRADIRAEFVQQSAAAEAEAQRDLLLERIEALADQIALLEVRLRKHTEDEGAHNE